MLGIRLFSAVVIAAIVPAAAPAAQGGSAGKPLPFRTVLKFSADDPSSDPPNSAYAFAANRRVEVLGHIDPDKEARLDAIDFRKVFLVWTVLVRPTTGYSITIKRVTVERGGPGRQLCVIAAVTRPGAGQPVTRTKTDAYHYVSVRRGALELNVPEGVVLRAADGKLLYATRAKTTPSRCRLSRAGF
jgi:hypothetical protein